MKRRTVALVACVAAVAAGCNSLGRQPRLQDATISPAALKPGDSAVITVKVADKHQIIQRVVAVVKEDPRVKLRLRDDGNPPDAKVGDGIWSRQVDVPFMAPPGQFTLDITAYNSSDEPVLVRIAKGQTGPLTATCALAIEYPPGGAASPQAPAPQAPEQAAPAQLSPPKKP